MVTTPFIAGDGPPVSVGRGDGARGDHDVVGGPGAAVGLDAGAGDPPCGLAEPDPVAERRGQLSGQRGHPVRGQRGHAASEHPGQQQGVAVGRAPVVLEHDARQEPVDHPSEQPVDAGSVERRTTVDIRVAVEHLGQLTTGARAEQWSDPSDEGRDLGRTTAGDPQGGGEQARAPQRVGEDVQPVVGPRGDPGPEGLEPQRVDVDPASYGRVGGVEDLEAAVGEEAVDAVGADPATDLVGGLEDHDVPAGLQQHLCTPQTGQARTHDHDVGSHAATLASHAMRPVSLSWRSSAP